MSLAFKFLLFWMFVSIGRPQDIFPFLKTLHLGDISALGTLISFLAIPPDQKNRIIFKYTEIKLITLFLVLMIVLIPFGLVQTSSLNFVKDSFSKVFLLFILTVILIKTVKDIKRVSLTLLLSMLSLSIAVFLRGGEPSAMASGRYSVGSTYDPNDLAMVIVTILPVAMMHAFHSKGFERMFGIGSSLMGVMAFILTKSRGGFLGLLVITALIFFSRSRFKIKYLAIILVLGVVFVRFAPSEYWDRISTIGDEDGGSGRTLVWKRSLHILSGNPFGYGANNFQSIYGRYIENDPTIAELGSGAYSWKTAHNSFLLVAVELGVLGLAIYVYLIYKAYNNFRIIKKKFLSDTIIYQHAEFLRISLTGFLVCAFFLSQSYSSILFLIVAISSVMVNVIARETENGRGKEGLNIERQEDNSQVNPVYPVRK